MFASASLLSVNGTLIAEAIVFVLMVGVLWRWVYPPVMRIAERREQAIEAGLQQAQEAEKRLADVRVEVEKLLDEARVQAREIADRAHREAAAEADELRSKARREAKILSDQARIDIIAEQDRALRELRTQVGALVVAAAARVLGDAMDAQSQLKLIEHSLQSLETLPR
ncbi:MAG: F0F1 ATP synthase subunit B [Candidatus Dormibacteria bacterium]|jgi:F-type H+-transporting ATPase subunit b